jgi:hypothetical chaperone protein
MGICGVDFGTSNSALALGTGEVVRIDPPAPNPNLLRSVLFFPDEERSVHAGEAAIREYLAGGYGRFLQSVKTWLPSRAFQSTTIRNRPFLLEDLVALLLRRVREEGERISGEPLDEVVLGRPARFSEDEATDAFAQRRLERAAELAGFTKVRFLIEPIAAAFAYEARLTRDERVLVGDFGAGTSDFTLMRLGPGRRGGADRRADIIGSDGVYIGGDRFDAEIMRHVLLPHFGAGTTYSVRGAMTGRRLPIPNHVLNKLLSWHEMSFIREPSTQELIEQMLETSDRKEAIEALHDLVEDNLGFQLFRAIEAAKVTLSREEEAVLRFDAARIRLEERITREAFERFCQPLIRELDGCVGRLLERTGISPDDVDAVFLTGGSSQIPAVRRIFRERFGEERLRTADAFTSVAEGLGRHAA